MKDRIPSIPKKISGNFSNEVAFEILETLHKALSLKVAYLEDVLIKQDKIIFDLDKRLKKIERR